MTASPSSLPQQEPQTETHVSVRGKGAASNKKTVGTQQKNTVPLVGAFFIRPTRGAVALERKGTETMAKLLKKAGDFVLDIAAAQYKRSMTRKLNAFGEYVHTAAVFLPLSFRKVCQMHTSFPRS